MQGISYKYLLEPVFGVRVGDTNALERRLYDHVWYRDVDA